MGTPTTAVVGQVFVIEDTSPSTLKTGNSVYWKKIKWTRAYQYFLDHWGDDYDFVAMYVDTDSGMPDPRHAFGVTVYNDVVGINHPRGSSWDDRKAYGTSRLQGLEVMMLRSANRRVRLQELGHRWGVYVRFKNRAADPSNHYHLLSSDHWHWGTKFGNDVSSMPEDSVAWMLNADGSFTRRTLKSNECGYCALDLYLMGMLDDHEVPEFYYINGLTAAPTQTDPNRHTGTRVRLKLENIVWSEGRRVPKAADSPRCFRQAFVVLTKDIAQGQALARTVNGDRIAHTTEFRSAVKSRGVLDTYLYTSAYDGVYIRDNSADTGTEPSSGFANSPDIWVRNVDDGRTTHQNTIRAQDNFVYVRVHNKGAQPTGEITVNVFRANFAGTEFLYPQDWRLEDLIGSRVIASVRASGEVVARFKWDKARIPPAAWNPCLLAEVLPIHRTKTLLRRVREDRRIAQRNITII